MRKTHKIQKIAIITINKFSEEGGHNLLDILLKDKNADEITLYKKRPISEKDKGSGQGSGLSKEKGKGIETYSDIDELLKWLWSGYDIIICFLATGIVVRKISTLLKSKTSDPGILIISFDLRYIIPLLSGHIGGGNEYALFLQEKIKPRPEVFLTTATDQTKTPAFDMFAKENNFEIENIKALKKVSNALLNKEEIHVITYTTIHDIIKANKMYESFRDKHLIKFIDIMSIKDYEYKGYEVDIPRVWISPTKPKLPLSHIDLYLKVPFVTIGIGINRGTSFELINKALEQFFKENNISLQDVCAYGSFTAKSDEHGLLELSTKTKKDIYFYTKEQINSLKEDFTKSRASHFFGIKGVCEPAAILSSKYKTCFIRKSSYFGAITLAAAF